MRKHVAVWITTIAIIASFQTIAQAQPEFHELNTPFAVMLPACGETVLIEGTIDTLVQKTDDQSGGFHGKAYFVSKGTGVGLVTGAKYVYSEEQEFELSESGPSDATTFSFEFNHLLTSAGSSDNLFAKVTFHLTHNGNGTLTALVDNVTLECRG